MENLQELIATEKEEDAEYENENVLSPIGVKKMVLYSTLWRNPKDHATVYTRNPDSGASNDTSLIPLFRVNWYLGTNATII